MYTTMYALALHPTSNDNTVRTRLDVCRDALLQHACEWAPGLAWNHPCVHAHDDVRAREGEKPMWSHHLQNAHETNM